MHKFFILNILKLELLGQRALICLKHYWVLLPTHFPKRLYQFTLPPSPPTQPPSLMSTMKNNSIECYSSNLLNLCKQIPEYEKRKMAGRNMFVLKVPRRQLEKYIPRTCVLGNRCKMPYPRTQAMKFMRRRQESHFGISEWVGWALGRYGTQKHHSWSAWERSGQEGTGKTLVIR